MQGTGYLYKNMTPFLDSFEFHKPSFLKKASQGPSGYLFCLGSVWRLSYLCKKKRKRYSSGFFPLVFGQLYLNKISGLEQ